MASLKKGLALRTAQQLAPKVTRLAPGLTQSFVREALHRALVGVGPLPPAAEAARVQLDEQRGDVDKAVRELIENHVAYAGVEGLATNLGGLITATILTLFVLPAVSRLVLGRGERRRDATVAEPATA